MSAVRTMVVKSLTRNTESDVIATLVPFTEGERGINKGEVVYSMTLIVRNEYPPEIDSQYVVTVERV